ncbi:calpain-B-like [Argopecten irradians]|uniref:calpain-B-like n=1 Tax=Argopecten irradians TaxID=31199 RepID=UPI003724B667
MGSLLSKCTGRDSRDFDDLNAPKPAPNPASPAPVPEPDPTPPPRDPTPPPRDPTPPPPDPTPPRDPTPPPRDPTPPPPDPTPPREPTPPPRDPTPPPREPTPPPAVDLPPSRDPTPPPPPSVTPPRGSSPTPGLHFGTEYKQTHLDTFEVHVDFRSKPTAFDIERRPFVTSGLYTDYEFPLEVALPKPDPHGREIEWKRPTDIRSNPVLFSDGTSKYDIGQRSIGTCWFLAMVTNIADKPNLLKKVIPSDAYPVGTPAYDGVFHCQFWRYGVWEDVYIDDNLPIVYGNSVYGAHSDTDENEMWVALLEKAFARCYGSYEAITGGQSAASYVALTSGVPEEVDFTSGEVSPDEIFYRLTNAHRSGAMVACAVPGNYNGYKGLIGNHEYTLTGTAKVGDTRLVRVRNPWGQSEWEGAWGDGCLVQPTNVLHHRRTKATDSRIHHKNSPQRSFRYLVQPGKFHLHTQCLTGNIIQGVNAGGQVSHETVGTNPQFRITVNQTGFVRFQVLQDEKPQLVPLGIRMWRDDGDVQVPLEYRWINLNYREAGVIVLMTDNDDGKFTQGRNVKADYMLDPGNYVLLLHLNTPEEETKFALLVQSEYQPDITGYQLGN